VGTCMDMCPYFEREERQFQKSVDKLEIDPKTGLIDPKRAVKAFHRPAAGNESALPSDVRPPPVLVGTLDYLINTIVGGHPDLMSTHGFVRDRTRGIRQDFTLQNYRGLETIDCHERIARYHILCIHQLAHDDRFVLQQEMEQLQKTMTTLNELYDDARKDGIVCPNEPEFRAYQILLYIHDTESQRAVQRWGFADTDIGVQQALRLHQAAFRNAPRFFNLLRKKETTYLMGCLSEAHFYHIRKEHFRKMRQAYNRDATSVTLADIERQLGFDHKSDLDRYCEHFGLETALDSQGEEYIVPNRNFDGMDGNTNFEIEIEERIRG
ncbi:SAC3/GANP/Nin1/mts3/eIF-3 p25 family-domain-containing protein, partial [Kalaharituber pfeilii]